MLNQVKFVLELVNVAYIPSIRRNLLSFFLFFWTSLVIVSNSQKEKLTNIVTLFFLVMDLYMVIVS